MTTAEGIEAINGYLGLIRSSTGDALLENGQRWVGSSLPRKYRKGLMSYCYYNAWESVRRSKHLEYCEGYAIAGDIGIPIPFDHAWVVDRRTGKVVERTWVNNAEKPNVYVGFVIPRDIVRTALQITPDTLGVISADSAPIMNMADLIALTALRVRTSSTTASKRRCAALMPFIFTPMVTPL